MSEQSREKVLFIAYNFPPMGGIGVNRSVNFVHHLRKFGYEPVVLTVEEKVLHQLEYKIDEQLLKGLPEGIMIHRAPDLMPHGLVKLLMKLKVYRLFWYIFYPLLWEPAALWPFSAYRSAVKLIREHDIKLIYTSSGPYSAMMLGAMLKWWQPVKWVADIRDPYTEHYGIWPSKLHWHFSRWMEKIFFRLPDRLIVVTPEMERIYQRRKLHPKLAIITNGF